MAATDLNIRTDKEIRAPGRRSLIRGFLLWSELILRN